VQVPGAAGLLSSVRRFCQKTELLGEPFIHRWRQQISCVAVDRAEVGRPQPLWWNSSP
jgi:hypothetical protein